MLKSVDLQYINLGIVGTDSYLTQIARKGESAQIIKIIQKGKSADENIKNLLMEIDKIFGEFANGAT